MHLLFLAEKYPPDIGGVAASAARLSRALAALGHDVHVFTLTRDLPAGSVERAETQPRLTRHRFGQSKNLDFTLQQALTFLGWLHGRHAFGLVWGHYAQTAGFLAAWLGKQHGVPSVVALRGNDFDRQLFPPGDLARLEWCLRTTSRLVAVSADLARKVRVLVDRDAVVLPNAVDTAVFCPGPPRERGAEAVLGFSGELRAKKGLPFLLQAVDHVRRHTPARLLIIGEVRGGDRGEWERLLIGLGLADAVSVTGHLNDPGDVAAALRSCDVFLLPSLWEGMPNGLLEAMAAGVPVVASDAGGIPEIVEDGVNGLLVPRTHLHQFGPRVLDVLRMPEPRRRELIESALRTVNVRHSPETEQASLQALLASMSS